MFWILKVLPVSPGSDNGAGDRSDANDRCAVDAMDFVFNRPKGAAMSQKTYTLRGAWRVRKRWKWCGLDLRR